ncbi:MAG: DUF4412 domain-containing protein [Candidatus Aminicenantes bacterium]|nr:DUF4412 domain-containing protein [Candidatus Aminicenantes bacterium]
MKKILTIFVLICLLNFFSFAGVEWTSKVTTEGKKKDDGGRIIAQVYAQAGDLKQVFTEVSKENNLFMRNGYWLFKSADENIYIVNEEKKSYMILSLDSLLQLTGMIGQLVKIEILDSTIDSQTMAKETVSGYSCNHVRITSDYTMKMKIVFIKKTIKVHEVKDIWAAPNIKFFNELNKSFLKKDFKTGFSDLDDLIKQQMEKQGEIGFPLKIITYTMQSSTKGKVMSETTSTMEVTDIQAKNFPKSFFEVPAGYQEVKPEEQKKGIF